MFFQTPVKAVNEPTTVPAPIGGLNARDSIAAMPPTDAIVLRNWWPQPYGCSVRKGYQEYSTGLAATVNTIQEWASLTGTRKLFAWAGTNMFDVTATGPVGAAIVTGLVGTNWVCTQVTNAAGNNIIAVNGIDNGIIYNNSGVARLTLGSGVTVNTWAGLDPANASQVIVHQHRLWAVQKNSSNGWYLPPDAIQGTFVKYDFGPLFNKGGYLQFLATWTIDDGNGAEDHLVALSSNGEAVVYAGTDPSTSTTWNLVGVYFVGAPVSGRVGFVKAGGDLLALTNQGVVSMAAALVSTKVNQAENPLTSKKIQLLISSAIATNGGLAGWDLKYYSKLNMILINVPSVVSGGTTQFAANQLTAAWCTFSGMDASAWGTFNTNPMFGTYDGKIISAWTGGKDGVLVNGTGGTNIVSEVQQAYNYFGKLSTQKQIGLYQPVLVNQYNVAVSSTIEYDFASSVLTSPTGIPASTGSANWNGANWGTAVWAGGAKVQKPWLGANGMGIAASLRMITQSSGDTLWVSTNYSMVGSNSIL